MVAKEQALTNCEFHFGTCIRVIGPRGGVKQHSTVFRRNGNPRTWKTRPNDFQVPIKFGLWDYQNLSNNNADEFHTAADCPLNDPEYATKDYRQ